MAFPNELDKDLGVGYTKEGDQVTSISEITEGSVTQALHKSQSDDLSKEDVSSVKKFFDFMALHVLIPWVNAIVSMVKNNIMPRVEKAEKEVMKAATAASVKALDEKVQSVEEDAEVVREKIDLAPMGVISFDDISNPLIAATQALKEAKKFFPDNDVSEYKFVFRERKTGDLYYGTIGDLGIYESAPELLRRVGNPLSDYDEKIDSLLQKHEEYDEKIAELTGNDETCNLEVSDLKERVGIIEEELETPKPAAFVIAKERGGLAAVKILQALKTVFSEETDMSNTPVYLYDEKTKYLCITTQSYEMMKFEEGVSEKGIFLGDIITKEDVDGVKEYVDDKLSSIESDAESIKPVAYVEVENIESTSEAQKILKAVTASGLVPEETSPQEYPAYVYDRNTKFLYKCSAKEVTAIYTSLIAGGTPEMPEKICYLGDMVSKQYVDDLFQSIIDGNEVAY